MQMEGVACLGKMDSPEESTRNSRKESPENVLSRRGLNKGKGIMVVFIVSNHSEIKPTEQARRDEEVGFGFTSFGVVVKNI